VDLQPKKYLTLHQTNTTMATKYVDLQFLLSSMKNDTEQVIEFIQEVLELNAESIGSLNSAYENNNFAEMKATAHMLKSSADIFESGVYKQNLVNLESKCKEGDKEEIGKALTELNKIAAAWEEELRREWKKLS
jgi:HPt (histidine-containing phosphotransfer) domain-containing protein